jgi:hypothetical protein
VLNDPILGVAFGTITRSSSGALAGVVTAALLVPAFAPRAPGVIDDLAETRATHDARRTGRKSRRETPVTAA